MLENCRNARERWGGVNDLVDRWLKVRQELIVYYCEVSGQAKELDPETLKTKCVKLCELLVDYVSAGHFEVYEQLISEAKEFDDGGVELAAQVLPKLQTTTEVVLSFNDRLDGPVLTDADVVVFVKALSVLGEALETRFEVEDFLIEHLHKAHADKVMSSA